MNGLWWCLRQPDAWEDKTLIKKRQVCQNPVISAIIQFDLICIIRTIAVEATVIPCYYQICDLQDEYTLKKESSPQLLAGYY